MTRTLIIPDIHLKTEKILTRARQIIQENDIKKVVLLGDYFDDWNQTDNNKLYEKTVKDLLLFNLDYDCTFLLGNHDIPYITGDLRHYSNTDPKIVNKIKLTLECLHPQIATVVNGHLVSHAGFTKDPKKQDLTTLTGARLTGFSTNKLALLKRYEEDSNSPVWIRPTDLLLNTTCSYKQQIVGHTPVEYTEKHEYTGNSLWILDSFSTKSNGEVIGCEDFLIVHNNGEIERIR